MNRVSGRTLDEGLRNLRRALLNNGYEIETERWQGKEKPPVFWEILHADLIVPMEHSPKESSIECNADQPWADEHFDERVSGIPYNPPPSHVRWNTGTSDYLEKDEKFSHTYPERMWPTTLMKNGIRYRPGNLTSAVELLRKDPNTRQCYIPIWFPEDISAALSGDRVPCTFGWHFMKRGDELHCSYHMRSCDAVRHIHNDLYFANRLAMYLIEKSGMDADPGYLHFSATSFHCFKNDLYTLRKLVNDHRT